MSSSKYDGRPCEVTDFNNRLIGTGRIVSSDDSLDIYGSAGRMPILPLGTVVKVKVRQPEGGMKILAGSIYISNRNFFRVTAIKSVAEYERRRFFRVAVNLSASILLPQAEEPLGSKIANEKIFPARIKDISLCGMQIETSLCFSKGEHLRVRMAMDHSAEEELEAVVRRIIKRDQRLSYYGCELLALPLYAEQRLYAFILKQQQEQIRRNRGE